MRSTKRMLPLYLHMLHFYCVLTMTHGVVPCSMVISSALLVRLCALPHAISSRAVVPHRPRAVLFGRGESISFPATLMPRVVCNMLFLARHRVCFSNAIIACALLFFPHRAARVRFVGTFCSARARSSELPCFLMPCCSGSPSTAAISHTMPCPHHIL
jgi:hypothetical protein